MTPNTNHPEVAEQIEEIWTRHRTMATHVIGHRARRAPTDPAVEDAVADATVRLIRTLYRGRTIDDPAAWLIHVAWNEFLRGRGRPAERTLTGGVYEEAIATTPDPAPGPAKRLENPNQVDPVLERALARLSPLQRAVVHAMADGDSYQEIQDRLHLSYTAVNKALYRARRRLRQDGPLNRELHRLGG